MKQKEREALATKIAVELLTFDRRSNRAVTCERMAMMKLDEKQVEKNLGGRNLFSMREVIAEELKRAGL